MHSTPHGLVLGVFRKEADILAATRATRVAGYAIDDVFTPYAVHGLDEAMGLRRSRLTWVCLAFALAGLAAATAGQFWTSAVDWPLNVGGKPQNSLPAFLPIMFELTVLFGGLGVVLTLFVRTKLYPGKKVWLAHARVTNDRFVLAVAGQGRAEEMVRLWRGCGLSEVIVIAEEVR